VVSSLPPKEEKLLGITTTLNDNKKRPGPKRCERMSSFSPQSPSPSIVIIVVHALLPVARVVLRLLLILVTPLGRRRHPLPGWAAGGDGCWSGSGSSRYSRPLATRDSPCSRCSQRWGRVLCCRCVEMGPVPFHQVCHPSLVWGCRGGCGRGGGLCVVVCVDRKETEDPTSKFV